MKKNLLLSTMMLACLHATAQKADVPVADGPFTTEWTSLQQWECPEWFKDAKFGIWAHWGPQCHAEAGDWYARFMYYQGSGAYNWHVSHFGNPATFGLKDLCNDWKAQNWDPEALVNLYKSVGARYFMALGNHHDNFDLWDSPYQEWNSVNVGPKKDLVKGWSEACKKAGLPLGVSIHASHAWTWLEPSQAFDGNLTKEDGYKLNDDGTEKWWKGMDPQELYAQNHDHSTGWTNSGTIHSQWDWGNGANQPSEAYKQKFQNRVLELINDYNPDMLYFDDTAMPFYGCDDRVGQNILAHYYNHSAAANNGVPQVLVTGKQLDSDQKKMMMWDVERGIPDRMQRDYWQTCTCIGDWHYNQSVYNNGSYKSGATVVRMLVDIISKNGNLLLSVPVKSDGTIDDKEQKVLADIKAWMDINSESIYGTRTWKTFGEGPLADADNPMNAQGFNEGQNYSSKDVRYVQKDGVVYATIMAWPSSATFSFQAFSLLSDYYSGKVASVKLLGHGDVEFTQGVEGLTVTLPAEHPNDIAPVFAITTEADVMSAYDRLQQSISSLDVYIAEQEKVACYVNSGKTSASAIPALREASDAAKMVTADADDKTIADAQEALKTAFDTFRKDGVNPGGLFSGEYQENLTVEKLVEEFNFTRQEGAGMRFGAPKYWTVENFRIPNGGSGTKAGLDNYSGKEALYLGIWNDASANTVGDLSNARIYRKVSLEAGTYYFGAGFNTHYNIGANAYMFVSSELSSTSDIPAKSIAFHPLADVTEDLQLCGLWFRIDEPQDVYLGFQTDLANGASCQEMRAERVVLYQLANVDAQALAALVADIDAQLTAMAATVSDNTGFYSKRLWQTMRAACDKWIEALPSLSADEAIGAYYAIEKQWNSFLAEGKNVGGAPASAGCTDITIEKLHEADHFKRTAETDDGDRFGAPLYWTVENYGFGDQAGIDGITGSDCLHLEVWWNSGSFASNGYDISNVRLYQQVTLPEGRYFFGASYPSAEANEDLYIFASKEILSTADIPTKSVAYEKVNLAPADGSFRGIYFTLDEETTLYLGFQADFSRVNTNNLRASGVKLLSYGTVSYDKLLSVLDDIEQKLCNVKVNDNTGFYSQEEYDRMMTLLEEARKTDEGADNETITAVINSVNDAYADFIANSRNKGGIFDDNNSTDITKDALVESSAFTRADKSVTSRFASPLYWTVDNYDIPSATEGVRGGLDNYPGPDNLTLGVWDDKRNAPSTSDIANARVYRKVSLDAGRYFFGAIYNTIYNLGAAYVFVADQVMPTADIPDNSIAFMNIKECKDDGEYWGLYFTLDEPKEVVLGWQADLLNSPARQEFRAEKLKLARYGENISDGISTPSDLDVADGPMEIYSLQGIRLSSVPTNGVYIIRQGGKVRKMLGK